MAVKGYRAGCDQDHAAFEAAREKFDLRVSVTEFVIGRPCSNRQRNQGHNGCHQVDEGFDRIREQADRVGQPESAQLKANGYKRGQDGKPGEAFQIAAIKRAHGILLYREDGNFSKGRWQCMPLRRARFDLGLLTLKNLERVLEE
jgi:hypothetical protein